MRSGPILVVALAIIAGCGRQHQPHQPVKTTRNASSPSASPTRSAADEIWLEDWTDLETVTFKPGAARHNRYSFASAFKGTRFIRFDALPRVERLPISLLFEGEPTPPTTAAGKLAHSLGWAVVGEAGSGAL